MGTIDSGVEKDEGYIFSFFVHKNSPAEETDQFHPLVSAHQYVCLFLHSYPTSEMIFMIGRSCRNREEHKEMSMCESLIESILHIIKKLCILAAEEGHSFSAHVICEPVLSSKIYILCGICRFRLQDQNAKIHPSAKNCISAAGNRRMGPLVST